MGWEVLGWKRRRSRRREEDTAKVDIANIATLRVLKIRERCKR